MYIFLDESGDLGFNFQKNKTSKFFIVTGLFVVQKRPIEKVVSSVHQYLRKKYKRPNNTLHAFKEKIVTRRRFLKYLNKKECKIYTLIIEKKELIFTQISKPNLYTLLMKDLLDRILADPLLKRENISIVFSRRETNKYLNNQFLTDLKKYFSEKYPNINLDVYIKGPHEEKALQAADFASWAVYRRYE